MNTVNLIGRLLKEVDLKYISTGTAVATGDLAVNRPFKNQQGENECDFIRCVFWRKIAENTAIFTKKGSKIAVTGMLQTRNYEQDGRKVYVTEVIVNNVEFLETKNSNSTPNSKSNTNENAANDFNGQIIEINEDDLPF